MRKLSIYGPSLIVLGTAVLVLVVGPSAVWRLTYARTSARIIQASESLEANPILERLNQAYRDIATLVEPSVVHISTERTEKTPFSEQVYGSSGSGWIYDELGNIVTNYHVIEDAERIEVQLHTGEMRRAEVVGFDQLTDIALIRIAPGRLSPAARGGIDDGDYRPVRQGDIVFAFGSPFDFRFSMSKGVVSGIGRSVGVIRDERGRWLGYENFIQVDAAINPGNSGGPLTDAGGRVIGMNTAIATNPSGGRFDEGQFAGIGLAIPVTMIEPVIEQILATGSVQKGFLGVSVVDGSQPVADEIVRILEFRGFGLVVALIEPGNPAFAAGLRDGDVITAVNGETVATHARLAAATREIDPDDEVTLHVWRYDSDADASGELRISVPGYVANGFRGVWLLQLEQPISDWLSILGFAGRGVRIARLEPGRPARLAGLQHGDVITHVNDEPVTSVPQLRSVISSMPPGDVASVRVWRYDHDTGQSRRLTAEVELDRLDLARMTGVIPRDETGDTLERIGLGRIVTSTPDLCRDLGVRYHQGVLVETATAVESGDAIEPGSIIVSVMDRAVADLEAFLAEVENFDLNRGVRIAFIRPDQTRGEAFLQLH